MRIIEYGHYSGSPYTLAGTWSREDAERYVGLETAEAALAGRRERFDIVPATGTSSSD
ncbi:hypothetical protein [Amycolatopsis saalfeldensis]|uniref:hypothetical protein n=1 Tax=Amycolatopsis saalfeldensis TaxID=394193 RepID=UPI0015A5BE35|nr:hypothetical protein [Amycolatopsis saalfeldensis]